MAAGIAAHVVLRDQPAWAGAAVAYGMAIAFAGLFALQFVEKTTTGSLIVFAVLALLLVLGGIGIGLRAGSAAMLWLGYGGFSIEVLGIYFKTVGTLLGSSLFFLTAGAIVIVLAVIAYRLHARAHSAQEASP
jgi:uncharacterized membrane protein